MSSTLSRLWSRWRGSPQAEGVNELPVRVKGTEFTRTRAAFSMVFTVSRDED